MGAEKQFFPAIGSKFNSCHAANSGQFCSGGGGGGGAGGGATGGGGTPTGHAFGSLGDTIHPDSINGQQPTKTVAKLATYLKDNKPKIEPGKYTDLSKRGGTIMHNASISFRKNTPYNRAEGMLNRQALANDLNNLANDIRGAIR